MEKNVTNYFEELSSKTAVSHFIIVTFDSINAKLVAYSDKYIITTPSTHQANMAKFWHTRLLILSARRQRRCITLR